MNTTTFLTGAITYHLMLCAIPCFARGERVRGTLAWIIPALFICGITAFSPSFEPWQRLWLGTVGLLFTIKSCILLTRTTLELQQYSEVGLLLYMSVWPGMDPKPFVARTKCVEDGTRFVRGYLRMWLGVLCIAISSITTVMPGGSNWLCLAGILLIVHFGYADILSCILRLAGWNVQPLFDAPFKSASLTDFWSKRWNRAFVEMDKILFFPLARRLFKPQAAILCVFLISGLLHEIGISYASGQQWGWPALYFLIQGIGMLIDQSWFKKRTGNSLALLRRIFAFVWILAPVSLLFNASFQSAFVQPLPLALHGLLQGLTVTGVLGTALWLGAIGHFCTLMAGLQVPFRLHWKEELKKLSDFNRKIFLYCAGFAGLMIITFGTLTFMLHDQFLAGGKVATCIALIISLFWIARLLVDALYFGHLDWPQGPEFVIGHAFLNTLFVCLATVYTTVVLVHWPSLLSNARIHEAAPQAETCLTLWAPLTHSFGSWASSVAFYKIISLSLWLAAIGNFCALLAGIQAPLLLHWKEELARLTNFNRKIMINYFAYTFVMIMIFGILTLSLHDQMLTGEKSAILVAAIIGSFWLLRLMIDCFYIKRSDWPIGAEFAIGHSLLKTLFVFLAVTYTFTVVLSGLAPVLAGK